MIYPLAQVGPRGPGKVSGPVGTAVRARPLPVGPIEGTEIITGMRRPGFESYTVGEFVGHEHCVRCVNYSIGEFPGQSSLRQVLRRTRHGMLFIECYAMR